MVIFDGSVQYIVMLDMINYLRVVHNIGWRFLER